MWRHVPDGRLVTWQRRLPREAIGPSATTVLLTVMSLHRAETTVRIRDVRAATGLALGTVTVHLSNLRAAGLVDWVDGQSGTLHPTVEIVKAYA